MNVFIVHPKLTVPDAESAGGFYEACRQELEEYLPVTSLKTLESLGSANPGAADAVVFFNRADQDYAAPLVKFLTASAGAGAELFPVALDERMRVPPATAAKRQSFDIKEQLRQRDLPEANVATVAAAFARTLISRVQPTLSKEKMRLFLSHRRLDGEEVAAALHRLLSNRDEMAFRDLSAVRVGEGAQEKIEAALAQSDAVLFLDTPKAGTSDWIARELEMAVMMGLPVVWVRIGPAEGRPPLLYPPQGAPHLELPDIDPASASFDTKHVDRILELTFRVSRQAAERVFDQIHRIKEIEGREGARVSELDRRELLFEVRLPRKPFRYPQRRLVHLVQFYGRWPKEEDEQALVARVKQMNCAIPEHDPAYDAVLLLGPIPNQNLAPSDERPCYVDSSEEYVSELENYLSEPRGAKQPTRRGLVISGAFPDDAKPEHQQHLTDAVRAFVRAVLDRGGFIVFGGHPTFTPLVLDTARRRRPKDSAKAVRLYQSEHFVKAAELTKYEGQATVFTTEAVIVADPASDDDAEDKNRAASLTPMRLKMIGDEQAAGLVAIGGRVPPHVRAPGVDKEIEIARAAGLPVFLVGSAGGRSAQLGAQLKAEGWSNKPNGLSAEENEELLSSLDYGALANKVLDAIGL